MVTTQLNNGRFIIIMSIKTNKNLFDAIEKMLQGLSFWMGYKMECNSGLSIMECVAVEAAIEILNAHIDHKNYKLECEYPYKSIPGVVQPGKKRADIAIIEKASKTCICVMEFKMTTNTNGGVVSDINKIASIPSSLSRLVVLLSPRKEKTIIGSFITTNNNAKRKVNLQGCNQPLAVIRAAKAMETASTSAPFRAICIELI